MPSENIKFSRRGNFIRAVSFALPAFLQKGGEPCPFIKLSVSEKQILTQDLIKTFRMRGFKPVNKLPV
ncbi:MAG: hypothetical protein A3B04_00050 [Candidatus Portnoybacteria bacterium RIFCSPLOWO2_02_FULL_39_11]|uniref:Uncharacterized protein n=1 Tax=Candidatus Portnoybacteria bacterium RIFCSPLOWO2_02_FULL_39_11 TaxID=1802001 RepID=A0A1G2FT02_9BACT|nr:MAG: hypothetical protein A3B04_00050 [Candidatus Portnoybacteria bacterium RIFCSPLOWO2_02_FULL_39_11]